MHRACMGEGQRGRHRIPSELQALSCWHRARCGAWTHKPRDLDPSQRRRLNRLSRPGAPVFCLLIQGHKMSFHVCVYCISFSNVSRFPLYQSFTFFVTFIPKDVILFDIIDELPFLISSLTWLSLVYRHTIDLCVAFVSCHC